MAKSKEKLPKRVSIRIKLEVANRVAEQANKNYRSLPKEIELRLEQSLQPK